MRKGLIDMLINHLLWTRVGYALSDDPEEVKRAIDIARNNYEKKVEEWKNKKKQQ